MPRLAFLLTAFLLLVPGGHAMGAVQDGEKNDLSLDWLTDYEQALKLSKEKGLPVCAYFAVTDYNAFCLKLEREVFAKPQFIRWARQNLILLEVDFPKEKVQSKELKEQNLRLRNKYKITAMPRLLVLDEEGKEHGRTTYIGEGYQNLIGNLKKAMPRPRAAWFEDYSKAVAVAAKTKKPILIHFSGSDWNDWCKKLRQEVWDTERFVQWAEKNVVLVNIDHPKKTTLPKERQAQNQAVRKKFNIETFPTLLFLRADESEITRTGYKQGGPKKWITRIEALLESADRESP